MISIGGSIMDDLYKDASQQIEKRVADLLGKMTLEEKVAQLGSTMIVPLLGPAGIDLKKAKISNP